MKRRARIWCAGLALLLAALLSGVCAMAEGADTVYMENAWNFVDGSMDISQGIPEDAEGVLGRIRETGLLRVATEPYFPPQEFIDPSREGQDRFVGSDMEMARRIAERMGVELEIVPMEFTEVLGAVSDGVCDLAISALSYTPARAAQVTFSKGYFFAGEDGGAVLMIRAADAGVIRSFDDLADKTVVAQSGSLQEALAAEHITAYKEFRRMRTINLIYLAVADKRADAALVDFETAEDFINSNPDLGLMLLPNMRFHLEEQYEGDRVAARKGEYQLMYFVNGVIDELLESGEYMKWYDESDAKSWS